jgi:hypothetical protein
MTIADEDRAALNADQASVDQGTAAASHTPASPPGPAAPGAPRRRSPIAVELAVIAFLGWVYDWLQNLAPLRAHLALDHAAALLSFEKGLGIAPELALNHWLDHEHVLAYIASDFYDNAIFGVTLGLAAWLWWRRPDIYRPLRNDLVLANVIGFAVFWVYPLAPPRMLPGFIDVVAQVGGLGSWHQTLMSAADQFAAMPSMHLGWAVWCALVVWRLSRGGGRWRLAAAAFAVTYPLSTALVVMATANHYLLDVLAGSATTGLSVVLVEVGLPAWQRRRRTDRSAALATRP